MVKYSPEALDRTFSALSDPTRRAILRRLAIRKRTVTELAEPFDISLAAICKHLRVLEKAGLVVQEREGRVHRCRLSARPLQDAARWIVRYRRFWQESLDRLDEYLRDLQQKEKTNAHKKK
jgi:DNA-binding transcriptional ArsR family regulator